MGIDALLDSGGLKVTDMLTHIEREESRTFDLDRDIPAIKWGEIKEDLNVADNRGSVSEDVRIHNTFSRLPFASFFPDRRGELRVDHCQWGQKEVDFLHQDIVDRIGSTNFFSLEYLASLACLFPERKRELRLTDDLYRLICTRRELAKGGWAKPRDYIQLTFLASLLFPERRSELTLPEDMVGHVKTSISDFKGRISIETDNEERLRSYSGCMEVAMQFCLLYPERRQELGLDQQFWDNAHTLLKVYTKEEVSGIFHTYLLASSLNVLSAKRARITEDGVIEIEREQNDHLKTDIQAVPTVRGF